MMDSCAVVCKHPFLLILGQRNIPVLGIADQSLE